MAALPPPLSAKLWANTSFEPYDDHTQPHRGTTLPQLTLLVVWVASMLLWAMGRASKAKLVPTLWPGAVGAAVTEDGPSTLLPSNGSTSSEGGGLVAVTVNGPVSANPSAVTLRPGVEAVAAQAAVSEAPSPTPTNSTTATEGKTTTSVEAAATKQNFSAIIPPPSFDQFLQQIILLGVIMFYFYLCDYRKVMSSFSCKSRCIYKMYVRIRCLHNPKNNL